MQVTYRQHDVQGVAFTQGAGTDIKNTTELSLDGHT